MYGLRPCAGRGSAGRGSAGRGSAGRVGRLRSVGVAICWFAGRLLLWGRLSYQLVIRDQNGLVLHIPKQREIQSHF